MENLLLIAILGAGVWFWIDSMNARERAIAAATRACQSINVQLLDSNGFAGKPKTGTK